MEQIEPILAYVRRHLAPLNVYQREQVSLACGLEPRSAQKVLKEERNHGVLRIEALRQFFLAVERGEKRLPPAARPREEAQKQAA
ncbi:MAG: hypothetical protein ACRCV9_14485 [Burkholderiaceae bacterium]